eukprot:CAMPEP_0174706930 /NCGR_PEP_ID=MMETSP1094-20130205/9601_1 /TAXON_ID=156173 /ORGANISM="Chrysochromulina brevifilum, Strain UTEX LB 985" /LENGTH=220 /DNA_ID=CAMNT_0015905255 /DNA_START=30 /DNA_END=688 /DNA_ORIENTATION=+
MLQVEAVVEATSGLVSQAAAGVSAAAGGLLSQPDRSVCMLLYLSSDVFANSSQEVNDLLCEELRAALKAKIQIVLVHPAGEVAFDHYFDTCPRDLIEAGLLTQIAVPLRPPPYELVSAAVLARSLNGKAVPRDYRRKPRREPRPFNNTMMGGSSSMKCNSEKTSQSGISSGKGWEWSVNPTSSVARLGGALSRFTQALQHNDRSSSPKTRWSNGSSVSGG